MNVLEAIRTRRSIKPEHMRPDPIDPAILWSLFDAANWAPSHGLTEPWRFVVFEGKGREALLEAVLRTMSDDDRAIPEGDPRRVSTASKILNAPVTVAIVCAPSPLPKILEHEEIASVAMAVQNLQLAATAHGVAAFWSSGKKVSHPALTQFLALTAPARCLGLLYLGFPADLVPEGTRRPVKDKIEWRS